MARTLQAIALSRRDAPSLPAAAALAVLGIVYGDIGTSPLYALKQAASTGGTLSSATPSRSVASTSDPGCRTGTAGQNARAIPPGTPEPGLHGYREASELSAQAFSPGDLAKGLDWRSGDPKGDRAEAEND